MLLEFGPILVPQDTCSTNCLTFVQQLLDNFGARRPAVTFRDMCRAAFRQISSNSILSFIIGLSEGCVIMTLPDESGTFPFGAQATGQSERDACGESASGPLPHGARLGGMFACSVAVMYRARRRAPQRGSAGPQRTATRQGGRADFSVATIPSESTFSTLALEVRCTLQGLADVTSVPLVFSCVSVWAGPLSLLFKRLCQACSIHLSLSRYAAAHSLRHTTALVLSASCRLLAARRIEYFERWGGSALSLRYSGPDTASALVDVPGEVLFSPAGALRPLRAREPLEGRACARHDMCVHPRKARKHVMAILFRKCHSWHSLRCALGRHSHALLHMSCITARMIPWNIDRPF